MTRKASPTEPSAALVVTSRADGARFSLHAKPRASRTRLVGLRGGALDVAVAAPPVDGAANEAIRSYLAASLGVAKRDVEIVAGTSGRTKVVEIALSAEETRARLLALLGQEPR